MNVKKILLDNYEIEIRNEKGEIAKAPYDVKTSLTSVLLSPILQLDGRELLMRGKIVDRIEAADGHILLETADYSKLKKAFETVKGFSKNDIELVRRVLEAENVEVEEKKR